MTEVILCILATSNIVGFVLFDITGNFTQAIINISVAILLLQIIILVRQADD